MTPIHQDFDVHQGTTFSFSFKVKGSDGNVVDLTDYSARMSVKRDISASNSAYLATTGGTEGIITLGGAQGTVTISMTADQTDAMDSSDWFFSVMDDQMSLPIDDAIEFIYDLELISGAGVVSCPIQGQLILWRAVTR